MSIPGAARVHIAAQRSVPGEAGVYATPQRSILGDSGVYATIQRSILGTTRVYATVQRAVRERLSRIAMVLEMVKGLESYSQLLYHFLCDFEQLLPFSRVLFPYAYSITFNCLDS